MDFATGNSTAWLVTNPDHGSVHVDAPVHMVEGGPTLEDVDIGALFGAEHRHQRWLALGRPLGAPPNVPALTHVLTGNPVVSGVSFDLEWSFSTLAFAGLGDNRTATATGTDSAAWATAPAGCTAEAGRNETITCP